ncbi:replication-associated recombination protein A [Glaciecola sp. XM2]|jgi:putative ATPase|uniref:replication-associated recombination protein A n=1 Tax=Glaciecola sp. XM2 TaxID=1914931 RepID=UPI001BDE0999|nr:replication-associated recombination protein A [Glaciecola sp. XM2]MBT1449613.1 replication-associated recombination protein A [Glaciecola sp. XM2]
MSSRSPLADALRPSSFEEYAGNADLMGPQGVLTTLVKANQIPSMILWGPPGCGKTSLVHVLSQVLDVEIIKISAINTGIKDIKQIAEQAQQSRDSLFSQSSLVFVDEIHRFNKSQQDAFLPYVESGAIRLIGATTENPSFSINQALLSRLRVFTLTPLTEADLEKLTVRGLTHLNAGREGKPLSLSDSSQQALIKHANGDARRLLNALELAADIVGEGSELTLAILEQAVGETIAAFDKQGDHYYDLLSAFHKSIRGSATDASLYWFARMLIANTDVSPICRRLLAIASEDIGNADPKALQVCLNAWDIYHRVGAAEGERAIAQAVIYCALAPKSNAVYNAFKAAKADALKHANEPVPIHLRNAPTQLAKDAGHGASYVYPHNLNTAYATGVNYFPENMPQSEYYQPNPRGFEKHLQQKIAYLQELEDNTQKNKP